VRTGWSDLATLEAVAWFESKLETAAIRDRI
jgi:hypothetical protein